MNFGKRATDKKRNSLSSRSTMMGKKAHVSFIRIIFISLIAIMVIGGCVGFGAFKGLLDNAPDIEDVNIMPIGSATFVYDSDGNQLQKLTAPNSNRMPVTIDKIPLDLQHAVVAIEDERFYEHNGIDLRGIVRAGVKGITSGFHFSEGASTITQQLLKNNVFKNWTNESVVERFKRKFQEQYLAIQLEKQLKDKDKILESYLNTINLGNGNYGVQAAAHGYFNKDVSELTLSESTVIAGISQNPTRFNPAVNPEENAKRRKDVLEHMLDQGYITKEQYDECLADNVYDRIQAVESESSEEDDTYSYFIDELTRQVIDDLMTQKGYSEQQAYNALYSGGLRIYTTQDPQVQQICDEEYGNPENFPAGTQVGLDYALTIAHPDGTEENFSKEMMTSYFKEQDPNFSLLFDSQEQAESYIETFKAAKTEDGSTVIAEQKYFTPQPQSSMCIMDQHTGYVKAIVGGRGEKATSLSLNRATRTVRQPGSTFKIVSTYAPALNECGKTLATVYDDEYYEYVNGKPVNNWLTGSFGGPTTIREAIVNSVNVVAVKCITDVTPQLAYEYLLKFGFSTIVDTMTVDGKVYSDIGQPTALGGITRGVSNLELTAAYAAIANNGTYIKPMFYTKILDEDGNVFLDNTPEKTKVIKPSTAYLLTSAMEDVVDHGTGTRLQLNNMHVAGKTGTTESYNDLWFAGYTPYYTCTVWSGYDDNTKLPSGDYRTYHQDLWRKVMQRLHEDKTDTDFKMPATVEKTTVCSETGLLPNYACPTITEYFETDEISKKRCNVHSNKVYTPPAEEGNEPSDTPTDTPTDNNGNPPTDNNGGTPTDNPGDTPTDNPGGDTPTDNPDTPDTPDTPDNPDTPAPPEGAGEDPGGGETE